MAKSATYSVKINGSDITSTLAPILLSATVSLRAGAEGDTATIALDDTGGQIEMPEVGVKIAIAFGWRGEAMQEVFSGTVDEVISSGSRNGLTLSIAAKGFASEGRSKEKQRRHWDDASVETILKDAGALAQVSKVSVDPQLAKITLKYWAMSDESFLHMGRRLAARIGGDFQVQDQTAIMARRGAKYSATITAAYGQNLHSWDISPILSRNVYATIVAPYYDRKAGKWEQVSVKTGLAGNAEFKISPPASDKQDANRQAKAKAEDCKRASGGGQITIEGNTAAVPDATCVVRGARVGIDRAYTIVAVNHTISRSSGFTSQVSLGNPDAPAES